MSTEPRSRRLFPIKDAATVIGVSERTMRNYAGKGYFTIYRRPGVRGVLVDLDEVNFSMRRLPSRVAIAGVGAYGPKARVVVLPPRIEAVLDETC